MASPTITYSFVNGTTADASQVNQNFTDILNGITDGSKDLSINALTLAGALVANGNVTLGNGTSDDLTVGASLASTIPIKTTYSYDFGSSTIGLRALYLGSDDSASRTTKIKAGTVGTSYTLTLPNSGGTARFRTITDGSGTLSFEEVRNSINLSNVGISCSVGTNALTVALKGANGSDPSSTNVVEAGFRNATVATGTPQQRTATAATSLVVSSGSTLGFKSGATHYAYVYLLDNAGTLELGISQVLFDEGSVQSSTAEGGAGAADSNRVLYSTTSRSNVAVRVIARLKFSLTTAGTWDEVPDEISLPPFERNRIIVHAESNTARSITNNSANTGEFLMEDVVIDTHNAYSNTTAIFTCPRTGYYEVTACSTFASGGGWNDGEQWNNLLFKNGSQGKKIGRFVQSSNSNEKQTVNGTVIVSCAAGDTLEVRILQNTGAALSTDADQDANYVCYKSLDL